jgi:hypothetical protein
MAKLKQEGIDQTAVHNHLLNKSSGVLYMHVAGYGDPAKLAPALKEALALTKTPAATPAASASQQNLRIDTTQINNKTLGHQGKNNDGITSSQPQPAPFMI